jgi:hypothetical protein
MLAVNDNIKRNPLKGNAEEKMEAIRRKIKKKRVKNREKRKRKLPFIPLYWSDPSHLH